MPAKAISLTSEGRIVRELASAIQTAMQAGSPVVSVTLTRADAMILHTRLLKGGKAR